VGQEEATGESVVVWLDGCYVLMTAARTVRASCTALRECGTQFWFFKTGVAAAH